jgi:hypothetical protein
MRKSSKRKRGFGAYRGEFEVPDSFFNPLPAEELAAFEGEGHDSDPLQAARTAPPAEPPPAQAGKGARRRRRRKG